MYIILHEVVQSVAGELGDVTEAVEPAGEVPEIRQVVVQNV